MTKCLVHLISCQYIQYCIHYTPYGTLTGCCSRRGVNWSLDLSFFECVESFFSLVERESAASRRQNSEGGTLTCSLWGKIHCGWLKQVLTHTCSGEVLYGAKSPFWMKLICKDLTKWTASTIPAHNKLLSHHRDLDDVFFGTGHQLSSGLQLVSNSGVGSRLGHS